MKLNKAQQPYYYPCVAGSGACDETRRPTGTVRRGGAINKCSLACPAPPSLCRCDCERDPIGSLCSLTRRLTTACGCEGGPGSWSAIDRRGTTPAGLHATRGEATALSACCACLPSSPGRRWTRGRGCTRRERRPVSSHSNSKKKKIKILYPWPSYNKFKNYT